MIVSVAVLILVFSIGWSQLQASKKALYFAYGVNTNTASFKKRVPSARYLRNATLDGYEFRWQEHAAILPKAGSAIQGVLWEVGWAEMQELDRCEVHYTRKTVQVETNRTLSAETYIMNKKKTNETDLDKYVDMVRQGYQEHGLPSEQLENGICLGDRT